MGSKHLTKHVQGKPRTNNASNQKGNRISPEQVNHCTSLLIQFLARQQIKCQSSDHKIVTITQMTYDLNVLFKKLLGVLRSYRLTIKVRIWSGRWKESLDNRRNNSTFTPTCLKEQMGKMVVAIHKALRLIIASSCCICPSGQALGVPATNTYGEKQTGRCDQTESVMHVS